MGKSTRERRGRYLVLMGKGMRERRGDIEAKREAMRRSKSTWHVPKKPASHAEKRVPSLRPHAKKHEAPKITVNMGQSGTQLHTPTAPHYAIMPRSAPTAPESNGTNPDHPPTLTAQLATTNGFGKRANSSRSK